MEYGGSEWNCRNGFVYNAGPAKVVVDRIVSLLACDFSISCQKDKIVLINLLFKIVKR